MTTDYLSRAREALQEQMFSRLLGTEIHAFDARSIDMRLPITDDCPSSDNLRQIGSI